MFYLSWMWNQRRELAYTFCTRPASQCSLDFFISRVPGGVQTSTRKRNYPSYLTFSEIQITTQPRERFFLCVTRKLARENCLWPCPYQCISKTSVSPEQKLVKADVHTRAFAFILSVNIAKIESFHSIIGRLDLIYVIYCWIPLKIRD